MFLKLYKSTEVDRRTWLHVPSGTLLSTSNDQKSHDETSIHVTPTKISKSPVDSSGMH